MRPILTSVVGLFAASLAFADTVVPAPTKPDEPIAVKFSAANAAAYIDGVGLDWTRTRKCATCHTNIPYMFARPKIAGGDPAPMKEVRSFLESVVQSWETAKPRADYDVVATAFALAANDASTSGKLQPITKKALDRIWTVQLANGSWDWPNCDWPPLEHDQFYSVAYVAVAMALAPDNYRDTPAAQAGLKKLRGYLQANPTNELHHRVTLLWASTKVDGLLVDVEKTAVVADLRKLQLADGGWNLASLGPYPKTRQGIVNPTDVSDGYATGFVTFVLRQSGVPASDPALKKSVAWLLDNQRESGRWFTQSPGGSKAHYVTNVGSAFAVLALDACGVKLVAD